MSKWIFLIFQLLTLQVHASNVFSIECNLDNQMGSISCGPITTYRDSEEDRVGNYYAPNDSTATAIENAINDTNRQFGDIFQGLGNGNIGRDSLSDIITSIGANYSPEQQQLFIDNILGRSNQFKDANVIPVTPYLADIKPVLLDSKRSQIFNSARLKTSGAIASALKACVGQSCSLTTLQVSQNALNGLINTALNNSINADYLERWGEDTSFINESQQDFKSFIDDLEGKDLNEVIKTLEKQKDVEQKIANIAQEWDIPIDSVEINVQKSPLKDYADDLIKYKRCIQSDSECQIPNFGNVSADYQNEYKQLESIYKTTNYVRKSNIEAHYKESAIDYLNLSSDALISGNIEYSKKFEEIATSIADVGLGLIPIVSIGKDVYELFTGKNLVTGEELSNFELGLAAVGILTAGGSHYIQAVGKILSKVANISEEALKLGKKIVTTFEKVGIKSQPELEASVTFLDRTFGKKFDSIEIVENLITENSSLIKGWQRNHTITNIVDSKIVNDDFISKGWQAPFQDGTKIFEFVPKQADDFVRVIGEESIAEGRWVMKKDAIMGLSPKEIQMKYSLPSEPTHILNVSVDSSANMMRGKIARNFGGNEGAVQYLITNDNLDNIYYSTPELIDEVIK